MPDWNAANNETRNSNLPSLTRGDIYYIGSGAYNSQFFADLESGAQVITIKKATIADHGTSVGWNDSYGIGQASFPYVDFETDYYTFDGNVSSWNDPTGYGFTFPARNNGTAEVYLDIDAFETATFNGMTIRNVSITCSGPSTWSEVGLNAGSQANVVGAIVQYVSMDNCQVNLLVTGNAWLIEHSYFGRQWSGSADSGLHGVPVDVFSGNGMIFRYNQVNQCAYICIESNGSGFANLQNVQVYGNVFVNAASTDGIVSSAGSTEISSASIYNNTIINSSEPILRQQDDSSVTPPASGNVVANNLFYDSNEAVATNGGGFISMSYDGCFGSIITYGGNPGCQTGETGIQIASGVNPFVNVVEGSPLAAGNYNLTGNTAPGLPLGSPYNIDPNGNTRGADGIWDMGAFQFVSSTPTASSKPGLIIAYSYPNPAVGGQTPVIRIEMGVLSSVEITIFDVSGRTVNSATISGASPGIAANGQYYYDYPWTEHITSGIYFAVIHGKAADGTIVRARTRIAVVR